MNESYFLALKNKLEQEQYDLSLLFEPSITYSNMTNGLGFIGAVHDTTIVLEL